jgi:type III secretory pathway component EscV
MTSRWADADNQVHALVVAAAAEDLMRQGLVETPAGVLLRLSPRHIAQLRASVQEQLAHLAQLAASAERYRAVVITSADLRRHLRQLIESLNPELAVISYQELLPSVQIHPLGTVRFGEETAS